MMQRFSSSLRTSRPDLRKTDLSPHQRQLYDLVQSVAFGRIEQLRVQGGLPVLTPRPRVLRTIKFAAPNTVSPCSDSAGLKSQWVALFEQLRLLGDGVIERIDISNGLPLTMLVEDPAPGQ